MLKNPPPPDGLLTISPEKVVFVIEKAKEFDVKDAVTEPDPGSNAIDDRMVAVLEDHADDPVLQELLSFVGALNVDEQVDLVALMWLGREGGGVEDWEEIRAEAAASHNQRTGRYLVGTPLLADFLELGLGALGYPVSELESAAT